MMCRLRGFSRVEVLVVVAIVVLMGGALVVVRLGRRRAPVGWICATNLKGLGTAMMVYANDYDGRYPQAAGDGAWSKELGFDYYKEKPDFAAGGRQEKTGRTITASWYMLVREADVSPKSFVCRGTRHEDFDGKNPLDNEITELWDFGSDPYKHVDYAMQNPYGKFPAHWELGSDFAVAAGMSPWFVDGAIAGPGAGEALPQIITAGKPSTWKLGNSNNPHGEGQFVLYGDGASRFRKYSNCGAGNDNIFTYWSTDANPSAQDVQGGTNPTARDNTNDSKSETDSFLAI